MLGLLKLESRGKRELGDSEERSSTAVDESSDTKDDSFEALVQNLIDNVIARMSSRIDICEFCEVTNDLFIWNVLQHQITHRLSTASFLSRTTLKITGRVGRGRALQGRR
jgi:hypothetical protein